MNSISPRAYARTICSLAALAVVIGAPACGGDDAGSGGSSTGGTGGSATSTGGSGGSAGGMGGAGGLGGQAATGGGGVMATGGAGGMGGAGGSGGNPLAGEYNQDCLPDSPQCLGGWVCKAGTCDFCVGNGDCPNDDCNTSTFRCAAQGLCTTASDCPSNSFCDDGACVYDHPAQGTCNLDALYYAHDMSTFTPTYMSRFTGALSCLITEINGGATLTLNVFSDNIGSPIYNLSLTQARGDSIKNFLVSQGASAGSITVVAHGVTQSTGISEADRAVDRRVEFNWN